MALKKQTQLTLSKLAIRDVKGKANPFAESPEGGLAENVISHRGRVLRLPPTPSFHGSPETTLRIWKLFDFKFTRNGASESQVIIARESGKIYRRVAGYEYEILPGNSGFAALSNKPCIVSIANRMHVTDGVQYLIWNGWFWVKAGFSAPAAPTTSLGAGSLTGTFNICVTAAYQDNGVQIHEGPRSSTATVSPAAQNITVNKPTLDTRANYWNVYMSEISGAGNRMRRVASVSANSASTVVSALPTSTNPFAPIRNDAPQASRVLFNWKNRLGMGDRTDGKNFWFSAFEEVAANLNGAPEESIPGRNTSSISDLSNSWTLPDRGEVLRAGCWHENFAFLGTDRNGYVVQGDGGLLDGRALRDFYPLKTFDHGTCGPWGMLSTPYGLINLSPEGRLTLWSGGAEETDIGLDIQRDLDTIRGDDLFNTEFAYWNGNGRDWLVMASPGLTKCYIYDFAAIIQSADQQRGTWFHVNTSEQLAATAVAVIRVDDVPVLLTAFDVGVGGPSIRRMDAECQPAHLGLSAIPNNTYLSSAVLGGNISTIQTSNYSPQPERFIRAEYVLLTHRLAGATTESDAISGTDPTITIYVNNVAMDTDTAPPSVQLTLGSRLADGSQRAWLQSASGASAVGTIAKRLSVEAKWTGTDSVIASDGSGRRLYRNNELLQFALAWTPTDVLSQ